MSDNSSSSEHAAFSRQLPREVSQLHQGLQAAIQARIPIHLGRPADHRSLGKWRRAEGTIASGPATAGTLVRLEVWLQQAASVQTAPNPRETVDAIINDPVLPDRYRMALWAYRNTGRIDLVLEALSVDSRSRQNLARVLRPALAYLLVMVLIATTGLLVFAVFASPRLDALREDLQLLPEAAVGTRLLSTSQIWLCLAALPPIAVGLIGLGLTTRGSATILAGFGGRGYLFSRAASIAARIEQSLVSGGAVDEDSIARVETLVGLSSSDRPRFKLALGGRPESLRSRLAFVGQHFRDASHSRLSRIRLAVPLLLVATFGGIGVLIYCLILFMPLISLLRDMSVPFVGALN